MFYTIVPVLPMLVCLFWSVVLFLDVISKRRDHARFWLFLFMCTATLLYLGHAAYFNHCKTGIAIYDTLYVTCNLAVFPLYYEYVRALTETNHSFPQRHHLWLLPPLLGGITVGVTCQSVVHIILKIWFALQIIPLLGIELRLIRRYNRQLDLFYSDTEQRSLDSVAVLLRLLVLTSIISLGFSIVGRSRFLESSWTLTVPSLLFSALLFAIGYIGTHRSFTIDNILSVEIPEENDMTEDETLVEEISTEQDNKDTEKFEELALRITSLMKENKVYEYVNRLRIDHASQILQDNPRLKLKEVALMSGYTSSATFYRNFKQFLGCSPKEFLEKSKG